MKKILSILLAGIITFSSMWLIPTSVNAAETTTNVQSSGVEKTGVPLCQANIIANGYNNDGDSYYNLLKSMQDPLYYTLTELMLDDGVLCWTSNFWNAAFNSDFQRNPSYFYEVMLMGFLKYDQKQLDTSGVWNSQEMSLATSIYDKLADKYIDKFENPSYKDFLKQLKEIPKDEYENIISNIDDIKISKELLGTLSSGCSNAVELVEAVSEYQVLLNAKSERIEMLKLAKSKVTDNEYFTKAVDDIIAHMEETSIDYVSGQLMEKIWNNFLDTAWDLIVKDSPIAPILAAIDIEKMTLDVLFNSSETASNNFKLLVLYIVDTYFRSALDKSYNDYKSNGTVENAEILIQCYKAYIEYQVYGLDYTKTFIDGIVDGGPIHSIVEQIFFKENIENAAELNNFCDTQINNRKKLLELLEKSADNYYKSTGLDELVDAIQSGDSEVNIPVTGISFKNSEITLNSTEDICLINADVYPQNATNKKVVYTSSDPSILSVPSDGGFASQKGKGTVIVTATTEDGGFTATQTVNVGYNLPSTVIDKGECGDKVYWTLYSDGKLYFSGEGDIKYYSPWSSYTEDIKCVKICSGITSIGSRVFENCTSLTSITIPNSVTRIDSRAFSDCTSLTSITIPDSVTRIGEFTFSGCESLKSITIPDSVTRIGEFTFSGCESLKSITIPDGIEWICQHTFARCTSLTSVIIPDSVTSIDTSAFSDCTSLKSITIPDSVTSIDSSAFKDCKSLTSIKIPDSVTSIESSTFENCTSLTSIKIPDSVTSIESSTFENCTSLTSIAIPNSVTSIESSAFYGCKSLTSVTIPDSVTSIGDYTFDYCTSLASVTIPDSVTRIGEGAFGSTSLTSITIPDGVTSIGDYTFASCTSLTSITIPDSVTSIGEGAFRDCTNLTSITIPDSVASIEKRAFRDCTNLTSITIPDSIASIGESTFENCTSLTSITIPNSVTSIGDYTFNNCKSLTIITIPDSVTSIGDYTFRNCTSLTSITIPDSVTSIGECAFMYCENLTIYGYKNTAAEEYALNNGFGFINLAEERTLTDKATSISVSGVVNSNADLNVSKLENTYEKSVATYDITLQKDGIAIQPDGAITIKIPSDVKDCKVMWLKDDGTAEDMNAEYIDGCYVFTTNHLSVYALVLNKTILTGDANQDGIVNINDVTYLQMHIAGKKNTDGSAFIDETNKQLFDCVDMNKDGKLSVTDVTALQIQISQNN